MERRGGTAGVDPPGAGLLRSGTRPARRGLSPRRAGPGDRPGGFGKDPGADRASPAPGHRMRGAPGHHHSAGVQQQGSGGDAGALRGHRRRSRTQHPHLEQPRVFDLQRVRGRWPSTRARRIGRARPAAAPHRNPAAVQYRHGRSLHRGAFGHPAGPHRTAPGRRVLPRRLGHRRRFRSLPGRTTRGSARSTSTSRSTRPSRSC